MTHSRCRQIATLALSLTLSTSLVACGTDEPAPVDAGSSNDTGGNSGQDASGGGDSGVSNPDTGSNPTDTGTSEDTGSTNDVGSAEDSGTTTDTGSGADSGGGTDAGDPTDTGSGADSGTDSGSTTDAGGATDAGTTPDMGSGVDYSNRPVGECVDISDCGGGSLICDRGAAGGVCSGCGDCSGIPGPNTHTCVVGTCVPDCSTDDDCPPGRTCNRRGLCIVERCTNDVCPVPWFVCTAPDGICERATCFNNEPCPAQTTCTNGICVEDHSLP